MTNEKRAESSIPIHVPVRTCHHSNSQNKIQHITTTQPKIRTHNTIRNTHDDDGPFLLFDVDSLFMTRDQKRRNARLPLILTSAAVNYSD